MPIEIPADAPFKSIIIGGLSFNVPLPFNEGYVLRPKDAAQFNQVYHENLRNNFNKTVAERVAQSEESGEAVDTAQLQAEFNEYVAEYDFGERRGGFRTTDPVLQEAMDIGRELIRVALKRRGHKIADIGAKKISELAKKAIDANPAIMVEAKNRVAAKQDVALGEVDSLIADVQPEAAA